MARDGGARRDDGGRACHLTVEELKDQLKIRKVVDKRRLDGKELTVGGNRMELLGRLKSVMLLEDARAADGYDMSAAKNFYVNGAVGGKRPAEVEADEPPPPPPRDSSVERIEMSEEREGEIFYLIKWCGKDEADNTWVAQTALPDTYALELAASFEMAHVVAHVEVHVEVEQEVHEEEIQQEEDDSSLEDGEFYVDKLIDRRICVSGQTEYLVRWGGFGEEHDSWEPPEALPKDMMDEFDAAQKAARRDKRARRE